MRRELEERGFVHREQEELVLPTEDILDRYFADLRAQRFRRDSMRFHTGGYPTHFIDHRDGEMKPHTQASVLELMAVGERLPVVDGVSAPGTM
ncbi:MAG TPA: hypothetical protein QGH10_02235, partial [Armatimonadota bacterium]|nr:hypothetical protein [Armatimonadota bacterium]